MIYKKTNQFKQTKDNQTQLSRNFQQDQSFRELVEGFWVTLILIYPIGVNVANTGKNGYVLIS
jgi:hypothetical protein